MNKFIKSFERQFEKLHIESCDIIMNMPEEKLFWKPIKTYSIFSGGEFILRSAGKVEQNFGGLMTRLWDDPFEWALPEELSTPGKILNYLEEVKKTRNKGLAFLSSDDDLQKDIQTPDGIETILSLLLQTLCEAENMKGSAKVLQIMSRQ